MPNHLLISKHATALNTDIVAVEIDKPKKKGITNKKAGVSIDEAHLTLCTRWSNLARVPTLAVVSNDCKSSIILRMPPVLLGLSCSD